MRPVASCIILSRLFGPRSSTPREPAPCECGTPRAGDARERLPARFCLAAAIVLLLDVAVAFLYPYATAFGSLGRTGVVQVVLFVAVLVAGYVYLRKKNMAGRRV